MSKADKFWIVGMVSILLSFFSPDLIGSLILINIGFFWIVIWAMLNKVEHRSELCKIKREYKDYANLMGSTIIIREKLDKLKERRKR